MKYEREMCTFFLILPMRVRITGQVCSTRNLFDNLEGHDVEIFRVKKGKCKYLGKESFARVSLSFTIRPFLKWELTDDSDRERRLGSERIYVFNQTFFYT